MVKALYYNPLLLTLYMILCVASVMDKSTPRPLIYGRDEIHGISYYCEFATVDQLKPGAFSKICQQQNPTTRMIHEGKKYYPWLKFSSGRSGILLECAPLRNLPDLTCSEGFKVYSTCSFSCPDGFVNTSPTVTCEDVGPIHNISATWSSDSNALCKTGKAIEGNPSQSDNDLQYFWFLVLALLVIAVIVVAMIFRKKETNCKRSQPEGLSDLPFDPHGKMHSDSHPLSMRHGESEEDGSQKKLMISQKSLEEGDVKKDVSDCGDTDSETLQSFLRDDLDSSSILLENGSDLENLACCQQDVKQTSLSPQQAMVPSPDQPAKKQNCCTAHFAEFKVLSHSVHKELASVLEYWPGKTKEWTVYGYFLENYKTYGFHTKQEVDLYQNQKDHRGESTPIEFFLQRLYEYGALTHDLLLYFRQQEAKDSLRILLKFHECCYCRNNFEYEALGGQRLIANRCSSSFLIQ